MDGFYSLNVSLHKTCDERRKDKNNVCSQCYGHSMINRHPRLKNQLQNNYTELSERILSPDDIQYIAYQINNKPGIKGFRFNSIGELINKNHCMNLQNITGKISDEIPVTLWTKRTRLLFSAIREPYFNVIHSNLRLNSFQGLRGVDKRVAGTFNVYDDLVALNDDINRARVLYPDDEVKFCMGSCKDCMTCYRSNLQKKFEPENRFIVFELTKKEQNKIKRKENKKQENKP